MSEGKHTPGPWQVSGVRHTGDLQIGRNTRLHMVGPDGDAVAAVFYDMRDGKGFADARLIAAAPDLLEAARLGRAMRQAQAAYFKDRSRENLIASKQAEAAFDRAERVAIAKAEGR
jgi:hypothetical protein